jgi:GNAT superfamily N-acetyltransferase
MSGEAGSAIEFRDAREEDLPAVVALLADDPLGETREDPRTPLNAAYVDAFRDMQDQGNNRLLVAEHDGRVVGCLQLVILPGIARLGMRRAQIEGVRVARDQRGTGLGRKLFEHAIALAREESCGLVQLTTDRTRPDAHAFYESLGFTVSHLGLKLVIE